MPPRPLKRSWPPLTERRAQLGVTIFALVAGLPYGLFGPGIALDDQYTLFWAWDRGTWGAAGSTQPKARPLGALLYDVQYGLIGAHPVVWWLAQLAITAATAALLVTLLRRVVPLGVATACSAVWVLSANHASLDHWGAGSQAGVSLLLLVGGGVLLARAAERARSPWPAVALLTAAPLVYEATLPPALLAAFALPRLLGRRDALAPAVRRAIPLLAAGAWLVVGSYHLRHDQGWFAVARIPDALLGQGIARWSVPSAVLRSAGLLGIVLVLGRRLSPTLRRSVPDSPARLVLIGLGVAAVGYLAFTRYPIAPLGVGDRANVVSSIGGAMMWTGIGWALAQRRAIFLPVVLAFVMVLGAARVGRAADWANAGRDTQAVRTAVAAALDQVPPGTRLVVGPPPPGHQGIYGMLGTVDPLVQLDRRDLQAHATVVVTDADWEKVPPERRVVLP